MWRGLWNKQKTIRPSQYARIDDHQTLLGTAFEPGWRATTTGGATLLAFCLFTNFVVLIWAVSKPPIPGATTADDNPVLFDGDCSTVSNVKTWAHLAINVVSTLILATSTVCMQCLSAPTRTEVDEAHSKGRWLDVGILSTRNLRGIDRKRIVCYVLLGLTSIPLHLFYNSVVFTTIGTFVSLTILTTNDWPSSDSINATHVQYLRDWLGKPENIYDAERYVSYDYMRATNYYGYFIGVNPWEQNAIHAPSDMARADQVQQVVNQLSPVKGSPKKGSSIQECFDIFSSTALSSTHNIAFVTSMGPNVNGTVLDLDFLLAPGRNHWDCNDPTWAYNATNWFFSQCIPAASSWYGFGNQDRSLIAINATDPLPNGYWTLESCYYEEVDQRCTIVFAKWLMALVVATNVVKLATTVYTVTYLDFQPCITVGDMVASFMKRPDLHTIGLRPQSSVGIQESYRYEISRIYSMEHPGLGELIGRKASRHEKLFHQNTWEGKRQRWRNAASSRRWSVTIGLWSLGLLSCASFVGTSASVGWNLPWSQGLGQTSPDFVIPGVSQTGSELLGQTVLANLPQILLSALYVFYSGLLTTMLSARELAAFAILRKPVRVSPPRSGSQRSTYFLQVPYRYAIPVTAGMTLLHWLLSQSIFLVRLDEYDILGNIKVPSFESVLGYSLRGTFAATVTCAGIILVPIALGFTPLPKGVPLMAHNSLAISIACHPFKDEPQKAEELPLKYGRVMGVDENGQKRSRLGFSAGDVQPLVGGEELEDTRCLSTFFWKEHGLEHTCTLDRNSYSLFVKVMNGGVKIS